MTSGRCDTYARTTTAIFVRKRLQLGVPGKYTTRNMSAAAFSLFTRVGITLLNQYTSLKSRKARSSLLPINL